MDTDRRNGKYHMVEVMDTDRKNRSGHGYRQKELKRARVQTDGTEAGMGTDRRNWSGHWYRRNKEKCRGYRQKEQKVLLL